MSTEAFSTPVELRSTVLESVSASEFALKGIDLYVTTSCDRRCAHCFLTDEWLDSRQAMSAEMVTGIVNWATEPESTVQEITLLGGEPSRHHDFPGIVQIIHNANLQTRVVTNGSPAFRRALDEHPDLSTQITRTSVSLDAPSREANDSVRGNGAYDWAVATTVALKERGMAFDINTTVLRDNLGAAEEMIDKAEMLGAQRLNIHWFSLAGRGRLHAADQVPSPEEWRGVLGVAASHSSSTGMTIDCELGFALGLPGEDTSMCKVREGSNLQFSPDGSVVSCGMLAETPEKSGYIWRADELYRRQSPTDELALVMASDCTGCPLREAMHNNVPVCIYNRLEIT